MHLKVLVIKLLLFQSVGLFCQIDNSLWISNYFTYPDRADQYKHDVAKDVIWKTENDQVFIYQFERISAYQQPQVSVELKIDTVPFRATPDNLILFRKESTDTLHFTMSDGAPLISETKWRKKTTFATIPTFNQASQRSSFEQFLHTNIFKNPENDGAVAFMSDHRIIFSDLKVYGRHNPYWTLVEIDNEIFLIIAMVEESVSQIKAIDEEGFSLIFYYYDPGFLQLRFDKIQPSEKFNKKDLIGKWAIQADQKDHAPLKSNLDSLSSPASEAGYVYETLLFNDSIFVSQYGSSNDTSSWELQLGNEVLLLPQLYDDIMRHQWNIKTLTKDKLITERRKRKNERNSDTYFETVEFRKVE